MGSVSLEQPRAATPPTPVPTPVKGAAALAWVRGPHTTGNTLSVGNLSDLILLMSTMEPALETMAGLHRDQLQAAYLDLSRRSSRPPVSTQRDLLQRWLYVAKTQLSSLETYSKLLSDTGIGQCLAQTTTHQTMSLHIACCEPGQK